MLMSRIRLRPEASIDALWPALRDAYGMHRLAWDFFADRPDRTRDFLYRVEAEDSRPMIYAVSRRAPQVGDAWECATRPYEPELAKGDRLHFSLRANPCQRDKTGTPGSDARHDVVMVRKRRLRDAGQPFDMATLVHEAGSDWLKARGGSHGFSFDPETLRVSGYRQHRFRKREASATITVSSLDFDGILTVEDGPRFTRALQEGIGPAKGFGHGLMLVRRA